ncbi:MAG: hypothetical protein K8M05_03365 [Deltaproteobacteria bacterium]|nr:hypothetical protein [Kofleriaceae bacterium]
MRRPVATAATLLSLGSVPALAVAQPAAVAPTAVPVSSVPAYAGPGAVPVSPVVAQPVEPTAPELTGIARREKEDPGSDRAYLARTALVAPKGTVTIQARAPLAPGALGGISASMGRVEIGVSTVLIAEEEGGAFGFNAKVQLLKGRRTALAVTLDTLSPPDEDETLYAPSLVASFCADGDACNTLLSAHLTMFALDGEEEAPVFAGVSFAKGRRGKLVGELHITDNEQESIFAGYLGGRWGGAKLAFDAGIGFAGVLEDDSSSGCIDYCYEDDDPEVIPYPFVGLSARL